jgi:hypothetical protein
MSCAEGKGFFIIRIDFINDFFFTGVRQFGIARYGLENQHSSKHPQHEMKMMSHVSVVLSEINRDKSK